MLDQAEPSVEGDRAGGTPIEQAIVVAASQLDLSLTPQQIEQLTAYLAMIRKWNQVYNLTAVRDQDAMLTHHIFDSMAVVNPLRQKLAMLQENRQQSKTLSGQPPASGTSLRDALHLLDVGAGAGLPGVVLAICYPSLKVTCVDAVAKKTAFIQQVAVELRLPNLTSTHARVETLARKPEAIAYDVICSRAFASLSDFIRLTMDALASDGWWMGLKGKDPGVELAAVEPRNALLFHVEQIKVPDLDADRCIVWMRKPMRQTGLAQSTL